MDEPPPRPVSLQAGLLTAACALALLPGCAWMRGHSKSRDEISTAVKSDSSATGRAADDDAPSANVALDGSASDDGSLKMPDLPPIAAGAPRAPGADAASQPLVAATQGANKNKTSDTATTRGETEEAAEERPDGMVAASASSNGTGKITTADFRNEGPEPNPKHNTSITDLPGSFDIVGDGVKVKQGLVAATVNGHPIFAEDVLRELPIDYARYEKEYPPEQYRDFLRQVIEHHLERPIQEELLLQALKTRLKDEQIKHISSQIDAMFNKDYLPAAMKQAGFETEAEFARALHEKGSSIEMLRAKNRNRELAQQYLGSKVLSKAGFDRPDLLKYYKEHKQDYAIPAQAKWEQIHLKYSKNGGKQKTREKAAEIRERLENGEDFAELAREFSNGPNAAKRGGARGWTTRGALKDEAINEALFEQSVDEIGPLVEGEEGIDIIRVLERTEAGYKPFAAVQEDIKVHLKNESFKKASKALLDELTEKATIVKFTDKL